MDRNYAKIYDSCFTLIQQYECEICQSRNKLKKGGGFTAHVPLRRLMIHTHAECEICQSRNKSETKQRIQKNLLFSHQIAEIVEAVGIVVPILDGGDVGVLRLLVALLVSQHYAQVHPGWREVVPEIVIVILMRVFA